MSAVNINMCTSYIYDVNIKQIKGCKCWIYRHVDYEDTYLLSNFDFNISNYDLITNDLQVAINRASVVMSAKTARLSKITKLTTKTQHGYMKISKNECVDIESISKNVSKFK